MLHQLCVIKVTRIRNGTAAAATGLDEGEGGGGGVVAFDFHM